METTFGERIKALRNKAGITQRVLAETLGISTSAIIAYEKGQKIPSIDAAIKFAQYFGVSLDSLCGLEVAEEPVKSCGDVARLLVSAFSSKQFAVNLIESGDSYGEAFTIAKIGVRNCQDADGLYTAPVLNEFLVKYKKVNALSSDGTLTQDISDTWVESELSKLDKIPLDGDTDADT